MRCNKSCGGLEFCCQTFSSSSNALASFRSSVSKLSVNQPQTGASSSRASRTLPWSRQRRREAYCGAEFPARATRVAFSSVVQLKVQEQNSPSCL